MKRMIMIVLILILAVQNGFSWIYPEHRDITMQAIWKLDPVRRMVFEKYWAKARIGREERLSIWPADTSIIKGSKLLDYASFPAIGGDHSTSSSDMVNSILRTNWIFKVSDIAFKLKYDLAKSKNRVERLNKLRDSDLRLLKADPEYVSRSGANSVHFMLARPSVNTALVEYMKACVIQGSELNAAGAYWWFHLSALEKAGAYAADTTAERAADLLFSAFADEGFALHFLEDMFASGHVAGTRGNAAQIKGTHDHYNEIGIQVSTWEGENIVLMGDAFMRPEDADRAASAVKISLEQIIDAASGEYSFLTNSSQKTNAEPDTFDVGIAMKMPARERDSLTNLLYKDIFIRTAIPGLKEGAGELPRFWAEIGPFVGLSTAARTNAVAGGFSTDQNTAGYVPGVDINFRAGVGLDGVLNQAGDGLVFFEAGYRLDGPSTMKFAVNPNLVQYGNITSAIPSRNALHFRLRLPFYLIPGDLVILAPLLSIISPKAMTTVVATAGNGGLIPWQTGLLTSIGRFQFVLGREVGVYLYGTGKQPDHFIIPVNYKGVEDQAVLSFRSTQLEFPILEYRPFHMFSSNQTAGLNFQFYAGVDIPGKVNVISPTDIPVPKVKNIPYLGLRINFDWRYYFTGRKN